LRRARWPFSSQKRNGVGAKNDAAANLTNFQDSFRGSVRERELGRNLKIARSSHRLPSRPHHQYLLLSVRTQIFATFPVENFLQAEIISVPISVADYFSP
jgi:hypothetical protein